MRILIYPGALSPRLRLQDLRREAHEHVRAVRAAEIVKREADGIPLDDHTDWKTAEEHAAALAGFLAERDTIRAVGAVALLDAALSRRVLTPLPAYEPKPGLDDVFIVVRALEDDERRRLLAEVEEAAEASDAAVKASAERARLLTLDADFRGAVRRFVLRSVASMTVGDDDVAAVEERDVLALEGAGLLFDVFAAARDYQGLSPGKAGRFGRPPPST